MKNLPLALAIALPFFAATPAFARCDDHISYLITKDGRCINLTALTTLSAIDRTISYLDAQENPLVFSGLRLRREAENIHYLNGKVTNQSERTVRTISFQVDFTAKRDGRTVVVRSAEVPFGRTIAPGATAVVNYPFTERGLGSGLGIVVRSVEMY